MNQEGLLGMKLNPEQYPRENLENLLFRFELSLAHLIYKFKSNFSEITFIPAFPDFAHIENLSCLCKAHRSFSEKLQINTSSTLRT